MFTVWENGVMADLETLAGGRGLATAVNNLGQVVGRADTHIPGATLRMHATLWDSGQVYDLNDLCINLSGWELMEAEGINDAGEMVGYAWVDDQYRAFLVTPASNPVPGALLPGLVGTGLAGIFSHMGRRR